MWETVKRVLFGVFTVLTLGLMWYVKRLRAELTDATRRAQEAEARAKRIQEIGDRAIKHQAAVHKAELARARAEADVLAARERELAGVNIDRAQLNRLAESSGSLAAYVNTTVTPNGAKTAAQDKPESS